MVSRIRILFFFLSLLMVFICCTKNTVTTPIPVIPPDYKLSYGDSVFYLQNLATDYIIQPTQKLSGRYSGFPDGIDIDGNTGAINISKSETGLRYRITFKPDGSADSISTVILISGINFLDGFYKLTTADSIAIPVYNAKNTNAIPGTNNGSVFDEGSNCNGAGCKVDVSAGTINLAQTVRNGVFGATPSNNDRHEFVMNYRINDNSGKALNTLKIKLYYFDSMNDVTQEAFDIIASRQGTLLRQNSFSNEILPNFRPIGIAGAASPRPPCIFILAR